MQTTNMYQVLSCSILTLMIITVKCKEIENIRHLSQYCKKSSSDVANLELQPGTLVLVYDETTDIFNDQGLECHLNLTAFKKSPDLTANFTYDVTVDHMYFNQDLLKYYSDSVRFQGRQVNHQDMDKTICCEPKFNHQHIGKFVKLQMSLHFEKRLYQPFSPRSIRITIKTDDPIGENEARNLMIGTISVLASLGTIIGIIVYCLECRSRRPRRELLQDQQRDLARLRPNNPHTNYGAVQPSNEQFSE